MNHDLDLPELELLYEADVRLAAPELHGTTPAGDRAVHVITSGSVTGRLSGSILPGGGNWGLTLPDGTGELDVRCTFRLDDGALVYVTYQGRTRMSPEALEARAAGRAPERSSYYFYITPYFSTAAPQHAWLNGTVGLGLGYMRPEGPLYRVFAAV